LAFITTGSTGLIVTADQIPVFNLNTSRILLTVS
jgi:hypothetical protein